MDINKLFTASFSEHMKMIIKDIEKNKQPKDHTLTILSASPGEYVKQLVDSMKAKEDKMANLNPLTSGWKDQMEHLIYSINKKVREELQVKISVLEALKIPFTEGGIEMIKAELDKLQGSSGKLTEQQIDTLLDELMPLVDNLEKAYDSLKDAKDHLDNLDNK